MISSEAEARPSCSCVLKHPFFWSPERQLLFFQVRYIRGGLCLCVWVWETERETIIKVLIHVCAGCERPYREGTSRKPHRAHAGEWRKSCGSHQLENAHLCAPTDRYTHPHARTHMGQQNRMLNYYLCFPDLRRFRTYKGNSVRDLLRAMRNKVWMRLHMNDWDLRLRTGSFVTFMCSTCRRSITTTSCPQRSRRLLANCPTASLTISLPGFHGYWCTHIKHFSSVAMRDSFTPIIMPTMPSSTNRRRSIIAFVKPVLFWGVGGVLCHCFYMHRVVRLCLGTTKYTF